MGARGGGGGKRGVQRAAAAAAAATRSRRSRRGCSSPSPTRHYTYAFLRPPFPRLDTRLFFPTAMVRCKAEEEREVVKKKRGKRCEGENPPRSDRSFFFPFFFFGSVCSHCSSLPLSPTFSSSLFSLSFPFHSTRTPKGQTIQNQTVNPVCTGCPTRGARRTAPPRASPSGLPPT